MKKLLFILLITIIFGVVTYVLVINYTQEKTPSEPTYLEFNSNFTPLPEKDEPTPDITNVLDRDISSNLKIVIDTIYRDNYYVLKCNDSRGPGNVLILTALYDGSVTRDGYEKAYQAIKNWESKAVSEIGSIIFSDLNKTAIQAVNYVWFEPYTSSNARIDGRDFHRGLFYLAEEPYEMYYGWTLNYVLFAPSQLCLENAMMAMYEVH